MGGPGSGMGMRFNTHRTKAFVQERKSISTRIFDFKTMQIVPEKGFEVSLHGVSTLVLPNRMEIYYGSGADAKVLRIPFAQTRTNYGNSRFWMRCPNPMCQRRCGKLYLCRFSDGLPAFFCRKCLKLAYRSQNRTLLDRMIDKKWAIIERLKADSDCIWNKPKCMHWKTFNRLKELVETLDREIMLRGYAKFCDLKGFKSASEEWFAV